MQAITPANIEEVFKALNSQIDVADGRPIALVVIGGTALAALGLVSRTTRDVDVLGELLPSEQSAAIREIEKFPDWLIEAAEKVRRDFDLPDNWLNFGPTSLVRTGLPEGFQERLIGKSLDSSLPSTSVTGWTRSTLNFTRASTGADITLRSLLHSTRKTMNCWKLPDGSSNRMSHPLSKSC